MSKETDELARLLKGVILGFGIGTMLGLAVIVALTLLDVW